MEFLEKGIFEIRQFDSREEWIHELQNFTMEFLKNEVRAICQSGMEKELNKTDAIMYTKRFVDNKDVKFEFLLGKFEGKTIYKKMQNKFLTGRKLIDQREIDTNNIKQFLQQEIFLEGEK